MLSSLTIQSRITFFLFTSPGMLFCPSLPFWTSCLVTKSCPILCDPVDCSPPGSSVHGFSRQEYWSGWPFLSPGDLTDPGIELTYPALAGGFFITELPGNCKIYLKICKHHLFETALMSVVYAICFFGDPSGYWGVFLLCSIYPSPEQCTAVNSNHNVWKCLLHLYSVFNCWSSSVSKPACFWKLITFHLSVRCLFST